MTKNENSQLYKEVLNTSSQPELLGVEMYGYRDTYE
jgi:hypothetical protein